MARAVQCCAAGKAQECLLLSTCLSLEMLAAAWLPALPSSYSNLIVHHAAASSWRSAGHRDSQLRFAAAVPAAPQVSPWYVVLPMCSGQPEIQYGRCNLLIFMPDIPCDVCRDNEPEVRTAATSKLSSFARLIPVGDVTSQVCFTD